MTQHSAELELALRAAREATGSADALARVREGVSAKLTSGVTPPLSAAGVGASSQVLVKWLALLVLAGAGTGLYLARPHANDVPVQPPASRATTLPPPSAAEPPAPQPTSVGPALAPAAAPLPVPSPKKSHRRIAQPRVSAAPAAANPALDPDAEVALITQAQNELTSSPARALASLRQHAQQFPHGLLAQERDALRIDAERALGQLEQARAHARQFVADYPESQEARAIAGWLGAVDHKTQPASKPTP